ncbi:phage tail tape measure protein [Alkalihalobacillus sp. NPDC078783]
MENIWAAATMFYAPLRAAQELTSQVIELDKQMTTLVRVSNGEIDRAHILQQSIDLADRLSNRILDINEGIQLFARQGFRGDGLIAMTEAATMFSNISEMNVDEAASGITAIVNGFREVPEYAKVAVDAINEVDNNFAISSQDIVSSVQKSVGSANTFGRNAAFLRNH